VSPQWPKEAIKEVTILNEALKNCEADLLRERAARQVVDQALSDALGEVKSKETSTMDTPTSENIKLEYPVIIRRGEEQYYAPLGAEFFIDEHGFQWVKFFPNNGYQRGMEHMFRTEGVAVVRDRDRERRAAAQE
jgi:hypothetical protein